MISDLDETIKQLLVKKVPLDPAEVDICFDMPDREWSSSLSKPTMNLYLYDIRENHEFRTYDWTVERNEDKTATRKRAPIRVSFSYLITVWTNAVEDEHRLLWCVLGALFRHPSIPYDMFQGELAGKDYILSTTVAQPDGVLKNLSDFWGSLDNRLKPAINYVVNMPLDLDVAFTAPMVSTRVLAVRGEGEMAPDERLEITGKVYEKGKPDQVIAGVTLFIKEARRTAKTDEQGRFVFRKLSQGSYTLQVRAPDREEREMVFSIPSRSYDLEL